jgi:hypothetical protein
MFSFLKKSLFLVLLLAFAACDEDVPTERDVTYLYYGNDLGFFQYLTNDNEIEQLAGNPVDRCTGVAKNGIVIFKYANAEQALWGKCEDGSLIAVPIPESTDENYKYSLNTNTPEQLSYDGHHLAYFCNYETIGDGGFEVILNVFDCGKWEATIIKFTDFVKQHFAEKGVVYVDIAGSMVISNEGDVVWFVVDCLDSQGHTLGYSILKWQEGELAILSEESLLEISPVLYGMNQTTGDVMYVDDDMVYVISENFGIAPTNYNTQQMLNTKIFSKTTQELVTWGADRINIYDFYNTASKTEVISFDALKSELPDYDITENNTLSFAPDGHMISVAFERKNEEGKWDIFYFNRNGDIVKKLPVGTEVGIPTLSPKYTIKD